MRPSVLARSLLLAWTVLAVACGPCSEEERAKLAALGLAAQKDAFKKIAPKASRTQKWDEQQLECVLYSVNEEKLSRFKFDLEYDGDYKDMVEYLFHDIDSLRRRNRIMDHLRKAPQQGGVKVLTDVDDTLYANLIDKRYPRRTPYPGVLEFYNSLKSEATEIEQGLVHDGVTQGTCHHALGAAESHCRAPGGSQSHAPGCTDKSKNIEDQRATAEAERPVWGAG